MARPGIWADVAERFFELEAAGKSAHEIHAELGVSERAVQRWRRRMGISHGTPERRPAEDRRLARALLEDGCSIAEVARTLHTSDRHIRRWFPGATGMTHDEGLSIGVAMRRHRHDAGLPRLKERSR